MYISSFQHLKSDCSDIAVETSVRMYSLVMEVGKLVYGPITSIILYNQLSNRERIRSPKVIQDFILDSKTNRMKALTTMSVRSASSRSRGQVSDHRLLFLLSKATARRPNGRQRLGARPRLPWRHLRDGCQRPLAADPPVSAAGRRDARACRQQTPWGKEGRVSAAGSPRARLSP